jgi:hypothetical protein
MIMTKELIKKQNVDLRTRLDNQKVKAQIREDDLLAEIKQLQDDVKKQNSQIHMLQKYIATIEASNAQLVECNNALKEDVATLKAELDKRGEAIQLLTSRLNKDSSNSSKPPSTDGFKKTIHNNRRPTDRKPGGQKGHAPHGLGISAKLQTMIDSGAAPVDIVEHGDKEQPFVTRFELDIRTTISVREHRFHAGAPIPPELNNPVNYGPNLKAMCVYLSTVGLMSAIRVAGFIKDITLDALTPAKATVLAMQRELASHLGEEIACIKESIINAPVLHTDETPLKSTQRPAEDGESCEESKHTTFFIYARTYSVKDAVYITINGHKDSKSVEMDAILSYYFHIMMHDHDIKYYAFGFGLHGECNVHILRYLIGLFELTQHSWADSMRRLLLDMYEHKENDLANGIKSMDEDSLQKFSAEYDNILMIGNTENAQLPEKSVIRKDAHNLLTRLGKYKQNHLLFIYNYDVPFSNNEAERDLRWIKTQQKVSGCHRSFQGAVTSMLLMSFILTLKKRKIRLWSALIDVLHNRPVLMATESG